MLLTVPAFPLLRIQVTRPDRPRSSRSCALGLTLEVITNSGWRAPKATLRPHFPPPRTPCPTGPTAPHDPEKGPTALLVPLPHCKHTTVQGGLTDQVNRVSPVSLATEGSSATAQLALRLPPLLKKPALARPPGRCAAERSGRQGPCMHIKRDQGAHIGGPGRRTQALAPTGPAEWWPHTRGGTERPFSCAPNASVPSPLPLG